MLLSQIPGYEYPTLALFPFHWYEMDGWIIRALKALPSGEVKWMHHCIEFNGHAKSQAFNCHEEARAFTAQFNEGIAARVNALGLDKTHTVSLGLKAEKELTVQARLADEERMMLAEALRRHAKTQRPKREDLILPSESQSVRDALFKQLEQTPYLKIFYSSSLNTALARSGEYDWSRRLNPSKKCAMYFARDKIAQGFDLSGDGHWGKTKAEIRAKLLPRANQLLQLASVQKILFNAKARGQRVVVMCGYVFWYEESGTPRWIVKETASTSSGENGDTFWHEGTIISKNHGRIVVLPYIKANGQKVQGHTKNSSHDKKALPRDPDEYLELPFEILEGDLMIGLMGELPYE